MRRRRAQNIVDEAAVDSRESDETDGELVFDDRDVQDTAQVITGLALGHELERDVRDGLECRRVRLVRHDAERA